MKASELADQLMTSHPQSDIKKTEFMGQITLQVHKENLKEILTYLKHKVIPAYEVLMDLSAIDYINPEKYTKVYYLLHNPTNSERLRITVHVRRDEKLPSVTDIWEGADWYERELYDMFGVHFEEHPDLKRILMPDDWIGHPLRRDYALTEEPVQFKYGVKPKIPSKIISHVEGRQKNF